ncbi:hypothetical protein [Mesoterricola silvestris]|uniref:hypothetical protein n=1 Tax=Mesoterricola silvestris TaxID=2927979 RepID=UPI00292FA247|nr:hypothetical protein [Mesoterricola silvestris]
MLVWAKSALLSILSLGTVLEQHATIDLKVEVRREQPMVVKVTGGCGHSSMGIKKVVQKREGSSIRVLVYLRVGEPEGDFSTEITVPDDVRQILFGKRGQVIFSRP